MIIVVLFACALAQVPHGGQPQSFLESVKPLTTIHSVKESIDHEALLREDALNRRKDEFGGKRVGVVIQVNKGLNNFQTETVKPGIMYRLAVQSTGALGLGINFAKYTMPKGAQLFFYNKDKTTVRGAFTNWNQKENGEFAIAPVSGDTVIVEVIAPTNASATEFDIVIDSIVHHYAPTRIIGAVETHSGNRTRRGFGDSGACNVNVACEECSKEAMNIKDSSAMILTSSGSRICSGAMINNEAGDGRQYFLTAFHCGTNNAANWIFVFNYESKECVNPSTEPSIANSVQGSRLVASNAHSDFGLLELTETIPSDYNVFLSGFDATPENTFDAPFSVSHPSGDIKKCAKYGGVAVPEGYFGEGNSHWFIAQWDTGVTEGGSSGSPIYDSKGRIRGQLHGGYAACSYLYVDYYGRVSISWDFSTAVTAQLAVHLDPDRSGDRVVDGVRLNTIRERRKV